MGGFEPLFPSAASATSTDDAAPSGFVPMSATAAKSGFVALFSAPSAAAEEAAPAPQDLDVLLAQAREEGAAAERQALEEDRAAVQATAQALAEAMDELTTTRSNALGDAAEGIGRIVIGMAEQVIGQSLALHPDVLSAVVRQALGTLPDEDELQIRVSPDDVQRVRDVLPERYEDRIIADSAVSAGCRIVASHASIDATLEAAIEGAKGAVNTWLESRP